MFRRKNAHETDASRTASVLPTEGRPLSYRYPETQDSAERTTRIPARYVVESPDGVDYNVTELIMGRTVTGRRGERMTADDINGSLMDMAGWVVDQTSPNAPLAGRYLIEYPRQSVDDPIDGVVITAESNGLTRYDIKEVNGTILVVGRERQLAGDTRFDLPAGARATASVRARIPAGEFPAADAAEQTYEEKLMEDIRDATIDYNEEHP
jgi:hypothetical protein